MRERELFVVLLTFFILHGCSYDTANEIFDCGYGNNLGSDLCQCTATDENGGQASVNRRDNSITSYDQCHKYKPATLNDEYSLACKNNLCIFTACGENEIQSNNKLSCINITSTQNCGREGNACAPNEFCTQDQHGSWRCSKVSKCDGNTVLSNDATQCIDISTKQNCGGEGNACLEKQDCLESGSGWTCAYVCDETIRPAPDCTCHEGDWLCNTLPKITLAAVDLQTTDQGLQLPEGQMGAFLLSVNRAPDKEFTVALRVEADDAPSAFEGISVFPSSLTVTPSNWSTPQEFSIQTQRDYKKLADQSLLLTATSRAKENEVYSGVFAQLPFQYTETDSCRLILEHDADLHTSEDGDSVTVNATLSCIPDAQVEYTVTSLDTSEGIITSGNKLIFTNSTWNTPQEITITGENDDICDGSIEYTVSILPDSNNPQDFQDPSTLTLTNLDNDTPDVVITNTELLEGQSLQLNVRMLTSSKQDVSMTLATITESKDIQLENSTCFIMPQMGSQTCTFTVSSIDNNISDHDRDIPMKLSVVSEDVNYNMERTFSITIKDDDIPGLVFPDYESHGTTPYSSPERISEVQGEDSQNTVSYHFHLNSRPSHNVTVQLSSETSVPQETLSFSPSVTFTPSTWNIGQTIDVTAHDDGVVPATNPHLYKLVFETNSDDTDYHALEEAALVSVTDANAYELYIHETYPRTMISGESAEICVSLKAKPAYPVTVYAKSTAGLELSESKLDITPDTYRNEHCFNITAENHSSTKPKLTSVIHFTLSSQDTNFDDIQTESNTITVLQKTLTLIIDPSSEDDLDCNSKSQNKREYSVRLADFPPASLTINVSTSPTTDVKVTPNSLVFTPKDATTPQKVTLTCYNNPNASNNYLESTIEFTSKRLNETRTFHYYPIGKFFTFTNPSSDPINMTLVPGKYNFEISGAQGGGKDGTGGKGGMVSTKVSLAEPVPIQIYVGGQGTTSA